MAGVRFYLNGEPVTIDDPPPGLLLVDWLRSPEVALTGAKKGCGQGGCGACTVILSSWDEHAGTVEHRAINSCLRPVCALGGLAVNTWLYPRDRSSDVPDNQNDLFSSKEVGEPPLVLASSVFFAVKAAVRASRLERGLDGLFRLDAPATVQEVRRACELEL